VALDARPVDPLAAAEYPVADPPPLFVYTASADRYEVVVVDDVPELLPLLARHVVAPGFHGIAAPPDRAFDPSQDTGRFIDRLRLRGEQVLSASDWVPAKCLRPGTAQGGYLREIMVRPNPAAPPVRGYVDAWTWLVRPRRGHVAEQRFDAAGYNRWRLHLRREGLVPAASEDMLVRLEHDARQRVARLEALPFPDPEVRRQRIADAEANLRRVLHAIGTAPAEDAAPAKSKPKPRKPSPEPVSAPGAP
jgi:hypothetical protein